MTQDKVKGFRVNLYKHAGASCSNGGTSSHTDNVLVVDVVTRDESSRYQRHGLPHSMCVFDHRPGDAVMVLLHRPGQTRPVLYDAQVSERGDLLVADWGMASGVLADSSDSRWSELVGPPVAVHDRHEWPIRWCPTEPAEVSGA